MPAVVQELKDKGLTKIDNGMTIVDLSEYDMPPCIILKSDGSTIYATRDIAAAEYRKNTYDFYKSLYVVAYQQSLHFRQIFKVLELMGYDWAKDCVHVSFGMLYNGRIKDYTFSWEKSLNFDGETGPYAQYTYARACSVMRKADGFDAENIDFSVLSDEASAALLRAIDSLPGCIKQAAEKYEPYLISRAVIDICSCFNKFYYDNRIMDDDTAVRNARLALTEAARTAIRTGLFLVGLEAPERM